MNIALVVHDFDPGVGHGRYCVELARRLAPRHQITVYANRFAVETPSPGRSIRIPAWRRWSVATVFTFLAMSERRVRNGRHDVVHAQGLTCWRADVITAHVCNRARHRVTPPHTWRDRVFPTLVDPVEAAFYRQRQARHLIAISERVAGEIRDVYRWNRPVTVVPHGVDTAHFHPPRDPEEKQRTRARYRVPPHAWLWLFVGEAVKGLAEAVGQLPSFPDAHLLAISRSDTRLYVALAKELGVADRLHVRAAESDIAPAYRAADLFVYPSRYDTFGMVVAEALASGTPVVIGRDIGAAERIRDGENGYLVNPSNPNDLRETLQQLRSDPHRLDRVAAAGLATARQLTWDACATATEAVYLASQERVPNGPSPLVARSGPPAPSRKRAD